MVKTFFKAILKYLISFRKSGGLKPPSPPPLPASAASMKMLVGDRRKKKRMDLWVKALEQSLQIWLHIWTLSRLCISMNFLLGDIRRSRLVAILLKAVLSYERKGERSYLFRRKGNFRTRAKILFQNQRMHLSDRNLGLTINTFVKFSSSKWNMKEIWRTKIQSNH